MGDRLDPNTKQAPILVTGMHRSGTTWVGKMLSAGTGTAYISEPLNLFHRPGVFDAPVNNWYKYICEENQDAYLHSFHKMVNVEVVLL